MNTRKPRRSPRSSGIVALWLCTFFACGDSGGAASNTSTDAQTLDGASDTPRDGDAAGGDPGDGSLADAGGDGGERLPGDAASNIVCTKDADCSSGRCASSTNACVECLFDKDCANDAWCRADRCVPVEACATDDDCGDSLSCNRQRNLCTVCVSDSDCPADHRCRDAEACEPFDPCVNSLDCGPDEVCDTARGECVTCTADADCPAGKVCAQNTCKPACASDKDCTQQGLLCRAQEGVAAHCAECLKDADCGPDHFCELGSCRRAVCEQGETRCETLSGRRRRVSCDALGKGFQLSSTDGCDTFELCVQGGGNAYCKLPFCPLGAVACSLDHTTLSKCAPDGMSEQLLVCGAGNMCKGDACVAGFCFAGAMRCNGRDVQECTSGTSWSTLTSCESGQSCSADTTSCLATMETIEIGTNDFPIYPPVGWDWSLSATDRPSFASVVMTDTRKLTNLGFHLRFDEGSAPSDIDFLVYERVAPSLYHVVATMRVNSTSACDSELCKVALANTTLRAGHAYALGFMSSVPAYFAETRSYEGETYTKRDFAGGRIDDLQGITADPPPGDIFEGRPFQLLPVVMLTTEAP